MCRVTDPPNQTITLPLDPETRRNLEQVQRVTGIQAQRDAIRLALSFTARMFPGVKKENAG